MVPVITSPFGKARVDNLGRQRGQEFFEQKKEGTEIFVSCRAIPCPFGSILAASTYRAFLHNREDFVKEKMSKAFHPGLQLFRFQEQHENILDKYHFVVTLARLIPRGAALAATRIDGRRKGHDVGLNERVKGVSDSWGLVRERFPPGSAGARSVQMAGRRSAEAVNSPVSGL